MPRERWFGYHTQKRIGQQLLQVQLLEQLAVQRVLEVGPHLGLVTAMLDNAGYDVTTLDLGPRGFERPPVPHLQMNLLAIEPGRLAGFDALLCCETMEHLPWARAGEVLAGLRAGGARYLVLSVPYEGMQLYLQLYLNRFTARRLTQFRKLRGLRRFTPDADPLGHKWEIGYRGHALADWEAVIAGAGWRVLRREFTAPCRSVFHLCENPGAG